MNILLITHSYTPDLTPRAFRWAAVARELANAGHEVHVLCAAEAGQAVDERDDGVTVHRVRDWLINASKRVVPGSAPAKPVPAGGLKAAVRGLLRKAARTIWRATHWPDYACGWILPASKRARALCREHRFDWIVSISHPFSGHVVGQLALGQAPGVRWLVDIGDPFHLMPEPSPNNRRIYAGLNRWTESRIVRRADALSVTTASTRTLYEQHFPDASGKVHLVPPLLSLPSPVSLPEAHQRPVDGAIRLVFVGTLYRRLRSPRFLLACFSALTAALPERRIELHFYGATNDCADELASCPEPARSSLFVHGMVDRQRVHAAMADADILVNIGNDSATQLGSKVIEYMSVGKPILNVVSLASDASLVALAGYPATLTLVRGETPGDEDIASLSAFVQSPPQIDPSVVDEVRARYSAAHIANMYRSILESPVSAHKGPSA